MMGIIKATKKFGSGSRKSEAKEATKGTKIELKAEKIKSKDARKSSKTPPSPSASAHERRPSFQNDSTADPTSTHSRQVETSTHSRVTKPTLSTHSRQVEVEDSTHSRTGKSSNSIHSKATVPRSGSSHSRASKSFLGLQTKFSNGFSYKESTGSPKRQRERERELASMAESSPRRDSESGFDHYVPPIMPNDTIDDMIKEVDEHGDDKYRAVVMSPSSPTRASHHGYNNDEGETLDGRTTLDGDTVTQAGETTLGETVDDSRVHLSSISASSSYDAAHSIETGSRFQSVASSNQSYLTEDVRRAPSRARRYRHQRPLTVPSASSVDTDAFLERDGLAVDFDEYYLTKQRFAIMSIAISAVQLMILMIQLIMCGVASIDVNPMVGPFPDAYSEWGGKNVYLMLKDDQYWRIITPVLLHVGVLHLLVNVFCQLETCAMFEREWGSFTWFFLYILSGLGCVATSSVVDPDTIAVCSSGALMGLFGAKIAQIIGWTLFEVRSQAYFDYIQLDQVGGITCSAAILSLLSFFTYIDWSGHVGGLAAGFLGGMLVFCRPIKSCCIRLLWGGLGMAGIIAGGLQLVYVLWYEADPDSDLSDACTYFRNLFPEGYDCECVWDM